MVWRMVLGLACLIGCFAAMPSAAQGIRGATLILVPGAGGAAPSDFLVRNQPGLASGGETVIAESEGQIAAAAGRARAAGQRVILVGMSAGAPIVARALARGARADRVVLVSGILVPGPRGSVMQAIGQPARLPPTLVVANRMDACPLTRPDDVPAFLAWAGGRAQVTWLSSTQARGGPCGPFSPHGHLGADAEAVAAIVGFAR